MADTVESEAPVEEPVAPDSADDAAEDMSLSGIFGRALDGGLDDEDEEAPTEEPPPAAESVTSDTKYDALQEQLAQLRERQAELETENNIYRSGLVQQQRPVQAPPRGPEDEEVDYDELNKAIQDNPAKAFVDMFNKYGPKIAKTAEQRAVQAASGVTQTQQVFKSDQDRSFSDFGDYWEKDKEFTNLANNFYDQITSNSPVVSNNGSRYHNGAIYAAMSMAYAALDRQGKLQKKVVPLNERRKPAIDPGIGAKSEKGSDNGLFDGLPAREVAAMKRTAEKMGVSWDQYKSRMSKLAAREPGYGGLKR